MKSSSSLLRGIPSISQLLCLPQAQELADAYTPALAVKALRAATDNLRAAILAGQEITPDAGRLIREARLFLQQEEKMRHRVLINATGILLHTNLGRAPMALCAGEAARQAAIHYTDLEFDCLSGSRGDRLIPTQELLKEILGAEDALVVNNNAAAVLLILSSLAQGREVIVSRGELVEIGGSFRVPDVMAQSGCSLKEVGTTNKTRLSDYEQEIRDTTAALMKVHCSNYQLIGFTEAVSVEELAALAHARQLPLIYDLGSGALLPSSHEALRLEPTAKDSLTQGADVVCFSGDKLLGGPQAGIIIGKTKYLSVMKKHPLMRALRADKMTLAALEATLKLYRDEALVKRNIPLYRMLGEDVACLTERAEGFVSLLGPDARGQCAIQPSQAQLGGGSAPGQMLPSVAVAIRPVDISLQKLSLRLLGGDHPVVARVHQDRLLFDMRTMQNEELSPAAAALTEALKGGEPA